MSTQVVPDPGSWWRNKTNDWQPEQTVEVRSLTGGNPIIVVYRWGPGAGDVSAMTLGKWFDTFEAIA